jgi:hypothetical protein
MMKYVIELLPEDDYPLCDHLQIAIHVNKALQALMYII